MTFWKTADIAQKYELFRPNYPISIFEKILQQHAAVSSPSPSNTSIQKNQKNLYVADIGVGSGQALRGFLKAEMKNNSDKNNNNNFKSQFTFVGVDPSHAQLEQAKISMKKFTEQTNNISFTTPIQFLQGDAGEENGNLFSSIQDSISSTTTTSSHHEQQLDIVTVAQALHWINIKNFSRNLLVPSSSSHKPVLKRNGILSVVYYTTLTIPNNKKCSEKLDKFDKYLLNNEYWPKERRHIDENYKRIIVELENNGFSLKEKNVFTDTKTSSLDNLCQYLDTWSGVQRFNKINNRNDVVEKEIKIPFEKLMQEADQESLQLAFDFHLLTFVPSVSSLRSSL